MYGNNYNHPGGYTNTPPYDYNYTNGQPYSSLPAGGPGPRPGISQYGAALPYSSIPEYANTAPRPVHRRIVPPASMFDQTMHQRLADRFSPPSQPHETQNPFTPLASLPPSNHYLQPAPTLVYNPFHVRAPSPDPSQFEYTRDELNLLRAAGFRRDDRQRLTVSPDRQFRFVMDNASWLAEHRFTPDDMMNTSRLAPSQRSFVAREACALDGMDFHPGQMNDLALMAQAERTFVLVHGERLRAVGFSPLQVMVLATRPVDERRYVVIYGIELRDRGYLASQIRQQARDPWRRPDLAPRLTRQAAPPYASLPVEPRYVQPLPPAAPLRIEPAYPRELVSPARRPQRASTSELPRRQTAGASAESRRSSRSSRNEYERTPRRSTTTSGATLTRDERRGFDAIGLAQEAQERLGRRSDTVRAYVLAHGGNLLASGMSFEEILSMAEDTSGSAVTRPAPRRRDATPATNRHTATEDLAPMFSYLSTEDIEDDPSLADVRGIPRRTQSPVQMEAQRVIHPRNNAPLSQTERTMLEHAHTRWAHGYTSRTTGENFYRDTVSQALSRKLAAPESQPATQDDGQVGGYPNLSLLLAGVAYAEDNRNTATAPGHQSRVKALTDYLTSTDDPALLRDCDSAAAEGVTHCGDRVAYGLTRVEQVVMQRKIQHGEMPPRKMFESMESVFLQPRVENIATYLANARKARAGRTASVANYTRESFAAQVEQAVSASFIRSGGGIRAQLSNAFRSTFLGGPTSANTTVTDNSASESLEMYAALTPLLIQSGVNLVESAHSSTYGGMYRIEPLEIDYARNEINRHVRDLSDDFLQEFEGNSAVEKLLRQCFQQDFRTMREEREDLQDQADDALFDADAPPGTQAMVRDTMTALATMEKDWYREKLKVVLAQRHLLDDMPPLAPDLATD